MHFSITEFWPRLHLKLLFPQFLHLVLGILSHKAGKNLIALTKIHFKHRHVVNPSPHIQYQTSDVYFWIFPFKLLQTSEYSVTLLWASKCQHLPVKEIAGFHMCSQQILTKRESHFVCQNGTFFLTAQAQTMLFCNQIPFQTRLLILNPLQHHYHPPINSWFDSPCPKNLPFPPTILEELSWSSVYYKAKTLVSKVLHYSTKHLITCLTFTTFLNPVDLSKQRWA